MVAAGASGDPLLIDNFFKIFLYTGNGSYPRSIDNGMDLAGLGGLTFHKTRSNNNYGWVVYDTENGAGAKSLRLDGNGALDNGAVGPYALVDQFASDGYRINQPSSLDVLNGNLLASASWTFLNQAGFFTMKTYNGSSSNQVISHQLESVPGLILIKKTSGTGNWTVYHDSLGPTKRLEISSNDEDTGVWNNTRPTSSNFYLTGDNDAVNKASESYIAYIWSGGESDNALSVSVDFDGSDDYLSLGSSSDFNIGTGDFTFECWVYANALTTGGHYKRVWEMGTSTSNSIGIDIQPEGVCNFRINDSVIVNTGSGVISTKTWTHIAVCRESSTVTLYINGTTSNGGTASASNTTDIDQSSNTFRIGANHAQPSNSSWNGKISNFRYGKDAVYDGTFTPSTEPLTSLTNTKILCCNNSSTTGKTTGGTITANGTPTSSTDSPFFDQSNAIFGAGDESCVETGSYTGNGSPTGPIITLRGGWSPQFVLIKNATSNSTNWLMFDTTRGLDTSGTVEYLYPNLPNSPNSAAGIKTTTTGFQVTSSETFVNGSGNTHVFLAIRSSML